MRETTDNKNQITGYQIGQFISIHKQPDCAKFWYLTIKRLNVYGTKLANLKATKKDIVKAVQASIAIESQAVRDIRNDADAASNMLARLRLDEIGKML